MKLEVGMYVRTKNGYIDKIILVEYANEIKQKNPNHPSKNYWRDKILLSKKGYWQTTQNIIKTSYNIIDLIEVGDYANGEKIYEIILDGKMSRIKTTESSTYFSNDIKSIVTKEQFKSMEYEVISK